MNLSDTYSLNIRKLCSLFLTCKLTLYLIKRDVQVISKLSYLNNTFFSVVSLFVQIIFSPFRGFSLSPFLGGLNVERKVPIEQMADRTACPHNTPLFLSSLHHHKLYFPEVLLDQIYFYGPRTSIKLGIGN